MQHSPVEELIKALKSDEDYRHSWQANIAIAYQDAVANNPDKNVHEISNIAAENFLTTLCNTSCSEISPSEAIYGFCAWLTTRSELTEMGANKDCVAIPQLIGKYCEANNFLDPRDGYHHLLNAPKEVEDA